MVNIVTVNVEQQNAPTPNQLQRTVAFVSQGATNTTPGTRTLLTQLSDLTPVINGALALTSLMWSGNVVTAVTAAPHGLTIGDVLPITISGVTPSGYNGTYLATVTGTSGFTYPLVGNPGSETVPGVYTLEDVAELNAMATTFFGQGSSTAVYVLELGPGNASDGVAFLADWIIANPGVFYSYLVPRTWDGNTDFLAFLETFEAPTAKTYFYVTTTLGTYGLYPITLKDVVALIESPAYGVWPANVFTAASYAGGNITFTTTTAHGVAVGDWFKASGGSPAGYNGYFQAGVGTTGSTLVAAVPADPGSESVLGTLVASYYANSAPPANEFTMAGPFWKAASANPSNANMVPPLNLSFLYGVTEFPEQGNSALLATLLEANIWTAQDGAAGGLPNNSLLVGGNFLDGNPWNYWYATDWAQINVTVNITNAVINGSNDTANPLYYNQPGIDRLQAVGADTLADGVTFGLLLGQVVESELSGPDLATALDQGEFAGNALINAVPFTTYLASAPGDYKLGRYAGFTCVITPLRGFDSIVFTIIVTQFVAAA